MKQHLCFFSLESHSLIMDLMSFLIFGVFIGKSQFNYRWSKRKDHVIYKPSKGVKNLVKEMRGDYIILRIQAA